MTSKENMLAVLAGRQIDSVPVCPIFDRDYMIKASGYPEIRPQEIFDADALWNGLSNSDRRKVVEGCYHRHRDVDFVFCPTGKSALPSPPLPDIGRVGSAERLLHMVPEPQQVDEILASGIYEYMPDLISTWGRHVLLAFTINIPLASVLGMFGGYVDGLMAMVSDTELFKEVYLRMCRHVLPRMEAAASIGMEAVWITEYYAGTDTISPDMYRDIVLPGEMMIFDEARRLGLRTMFWFLGDLVRLVPDIMRNRPDALVLEPGRKGYSVDIGEIRPMVPPHTCLCAVPDELAIKGDRRDEISACIRHQFEKAGYGPLAVSTPILKADTPCETVDFLIQEVKRQSQDRFGKSSRKTGQEGSVHSGNGRG